MPLSDRHAPDDTVIKQEPLDANLQFHSIGRYYPEEYSSQIQAVHRKHDLIADIPATMAGIVTNRNDHALSTWANEERIKLEEDKDFYKYLEANKRQLLDLDADLKTNDKVMQMNSDLIKAREEALANDGKVEEAYASVFDKYEGIFNDTPALAARFNKEFSKIKEKSLMQGITEDIQNNQFKLANNLDYAMRNINNEVIKGNLSSVNAIQQLVKTTAKWYKYLPANEVTQYLDKAFNIYVQEEAQFYLNQFRAGDKNAEQTMTDLKGLHDLAQTYSTNLVDEQDNILKADDGSDRTMTFTLTVETQNKLEQALKDVKGSGSGSGGEGKVLDIVEDYKTKIGYDQIQKEGYSEFLLSASDDDYNIQFDNMMMSVLNSGASENSKRSNADKLYKMYLEGRIVRKINEIAKDSKQDTSVILRKFADKVQIDLKNANFTGDWEHYDPLIVIGNKTYSLGTQNITAEVQSRYGNLGLIPHLGTSQQEASLFWQEAYNIIDNASFNVSHGNASDFMIKHNSMYNAASQNVQKNLSSKFLLTKDEKTGQIKFNTEGLQNLTTQLNLMKQDTNQMDFKNTISPELMEQYVVGIKSNNTNPLDCFMVMEAYGNSLKAAGITADIYSYAKQHQSKIGSSSEQQRPDINDFFTVYTLSKNKDASNLIRNMITNGTYNEAANKIKDSNKDVATNILEDICDKMNIPKEDRTLYKNLSNILAAANITDIKKGNIDEKALKNQLESILNEMYVHIPNSFMKDNGIGKRALLKEASYMQPFITSTGEIDTNKINEITTAAIDVIKQTGYWDTFYNNKLTNPAFYPDANNACFRLVFNGKSIKDKEGNFTGAILYNEDLKNIDSKKIGQITALQPIANLSMSNVVQLYERIKNRARYSNEDASILKAYPNAYSYTKNLKAFTDILNDSKKITKVLKQSQIDSTLQNKGFTQAIKHPYLIPLPSTYYLLDSTFAENFKRQEQ